MRTPAAPGKDKHCVLIVDSKKFRQAATMHLLKAWADAMGLMVQAIASDALLKASTNVTCEMVILDVCDNSLEDADQKALTRRVRTVFPEAQLIVVSDREDIIEVCSAFKAGAAAFIPTSIDPAVALQALSFIKSGGSFFPPSVLEHVSPAGAQPDTNGSGVDWRSHGLARRPTRLSDKQEEVFKLLQQGLPNKLIARQLNISEATVKVHVRSIMRKLGATNRTQVAISDLDGNHVRERHHTP